MIALCTDHELASVHNFVTFGIAHSDPLILQALVALQRDIVQVEALYGEFALTIRSELAKVVISKHVEELWICRKLLN